jgi:predicted HAD superfamily Cof-like phosphohydrolase|tara:strand:- start:208 stop:612 length:405 start_codon:yes stop_codon:yes gene_type:complete
MTLLEQARKFREAFGQEMLDSVSRYGFVKSKLYQMQTSLVAEEATEFLKAADELYADPDNAQRKEEFLKELSDTVFVCYQFAAAFGFDLDTAMERVFQSNMSKLGPDGKPIYRADGKVLKGDGYQPPVLTDLYK